MFKIDFEKAYDHISWGVLDSIQEQMNFHVKWRRWIMAILSSARSSVLMNVSPTFEFQFQRGMRQGDPISPFLFIIGMEAFSFMMSTSTNVGLFNGFQMPNNGPLVSHLLFANDALLIGEWSKANIENMVRLLRCFHLVSGLQINYGKSNLHGVGVNVEEVTTFTFLWRLVDWG
ncbi:uncharacterized mitochondrial protein AtMg01250-like [Helianthus annuus]|uniref:uncharacterized mitochondrial protein AtMg01250-like n=1 Tax=Helianthus annuus TaxID=4232 RepID=UPI000B904A68|nr:uncharacterized mitochondrial protein AtMg01250-like [Helianthus annuus]